MARPVKATVDYFPHMTVHGPTMFIVEQRFGNDGYAFWFKLLESLGTADGMAIDFSNYAAREFLLAKTRLSEVIAIAILDMLASLEAIDADLWRERKLIWCQKLVDNLAPIFARRNAAAPVRPGLLSRITTDVSEDKGETLSGNETPEQSNDGYRKQKPEVSVVSASNNPEIKLDEIKSQYSTMSASPEGGRDESGSADKKPDSPDTSTPTPTPQPPTNPAPQPEPPPQDNDPVPYADMCRVYNLTLAAALGMPLVQSPKSINPDRKKKLRALWSMKSCYGGWIGWLSVMAGQQHDQHWKDSASNQNGKTNNWMKFDALLWAGKWQGRVDNGLRYLLGQTGADMLLQLNGFADARAALEEFRRAKCNNGATSQPRR